MVEAISKYTGDETWTREDRRRCCYRESPKKLRSKGDYVRVFEGKVVLCCLIGGKWVKISMHSLTSDGSGPYTYVKGGTGTKPCERPPIMPGCTK